ncbi:MAG: hypothetical protein VX619_03500 [bacterium]|nr:hypothetical protein [bacterium]
MISMFVSLNDVFSGCECSFIETELSKEVELRKWIIESDKQNSHYTEVSNSHRFLDLTVSYIRKGLFATSLSGVKSIEEFFKPQYLGGYCILAQTIGSIYLEDLGVHQNHQILLEMGADFGSSQVHAFIITKIKNNKFYLIDPTFAQFMYDKDESAFIGKNLIASGADNLARDLCSKGYSEIDDDLLQKYLTAFPVNVSKIEDLTLEKLYQESKNSKRKINRLLFGDDLPKVPHLRALKFRILNSSNQ